MFCVLKKPKNHQNPQTSINERLQCQYFFSKPVHNFIDAEHFCSTGAYEHRCFPGGQQLRYGPCLSSNIKVYCTTGKCSFYKSFYISAKTKNSKALKVNRRAVLLTKNIDTRQHSLVKFACVMNMLLQMNENAYQDHVQSMHAHC